MDLNSSGLYKSSKRSRPANRLLLCIVFFRKISLQEFHLGVSTFDWTIFLYINCCFCCLNTWHVYQTLICNYHISASFHFSLFLAFTNYSFYSNWTISRSLINPKLCSIRLQPMEMMWWGNIFLFLTHAIFREILTLEFWTL